MTSLETEGRYRTTRDLSATTMRKTNADAAVHFGTRESNKESDEVEMTSLRQQPRHLQSSPSPPPCSTFHTSSLDVVTMNGSPDAASPTEQSEFDESLCHIQDVREERSSVMVDDYCHPLEKTPAKVITWVVKE